jgi:hypothetical protein
MRPVTSDFPSEGTRFHQSRQSHPEHLGVSDGNWSCCWWSSHNSRLQVHLSFYSTMVSKMGQSQPYSSALTFLHCHVQRLMTFDLSTFYTQMNHNYTQLFTSIAHRCHILYYWEMSCDCKTQISNNVKYNQFVYIEAGTKESLWSK